MLLASFPNGPVASASELPFPSALASFVPFPPRPLPVPGFRCLRLAALALFAFADSSQPFIAHLVDNKYSKSGMGCQGLQMRKYQHVINRGYEQC
jgi:hypothetical protein